MRAVVVVLLMCAAGPAAAQSTRTEVIAGQQAEKAEALGVEGPSDVERVIRRVLLSPLLEGGEGIYPWFGSVYDGTGMAIGAGYFNSLQSAAYLNLQAGVSINNSQMLRAAAGLPELWRNRLQLDGQVQWVDAKRISFYGFGQDSVKSARTRYDYSPLEVSGNATLKPLPGVFVTGGYAFIDLDSAFAADQPPDLDAPGVGADIRYHVARGTVAYDWRTAPNYSTRGGFYRASFARHVAVEGAPYSFSAQDYEVVHLQPLVREQYVIALRGLMSIALPDQGHALPIMMAPYIGSGRTLRGFPNRRFTDRNRVLVTAEYRWRPSRYLDMAVFIDSGQVAADRRNFRVADFDTAWGIGARFHGPTFTAWRVEVARGREGFRMTFSGSQPF